MKKSRREFVKNIIAGTTGITIGGLGFSAKSYGRFIDTNENPKFEGVRTFKKLTVYNQNPRYFAIDGEPVFLTGATPTWTPISSPECDFKAEIDELVNHGGNFARILTFWPGAPLVPWSRSNENNKKVAFDGHPPFDLDKWNDAYWIRLKEYLAYCIMHNVVVTIELFDEPSIRYNKGPKDRWAAHPFNPDNNLNLTEKDGLPTGQYEPVVRQMYDAVRLPEMARVLKYQQKYVSKVLEETAEFSGMIIYSICNEYTYNELNADASDKTHAFKFPKYWADFIKKWGKEHDNELIVSMMPGRSPDPTCYFDDSEFRKYFEDPVFDAIDMAENITPEDAYAESFKTYVSKTGAELAESLTRYYGRWTNFQHNKNIIKPIYNSKILVHCITMNSPVCPEPVWSLFFIGGAVSRCHRPSITMDMKPNDNNIINSQRDAISKLRKFTNKVPFREMTPKHHLISGFNQCLATDNGECYAAFIPSGGKFRIYLKEKRNYSVEWCNVHSGVFNPGEPVTGISGGVDIMPPFTGPAAVIIKMGL